jgi:hypothetical protein
MQQHDPVYQKHVPTVSGDSPPAPGDPFHPVPLSHPLVTCVQAALAQQQSRRKVFRAGQLRVCLDGEERWQWDPRDSMGVALHVPLSASYLEIFGEDADGALLLVVFPLPGPEGMEDHDALHLSVTLEGGQTVALETRLAEEADGEGHAYVIQMTYVEAAVEALGHKLLAAPRPCQIDLS